MSDERICESSIRVKDGQLFTSNWEKAMNKKVIRVKNFLEDIDPLRQYIVEPRTTLMKDEDGAEYRIILVRRGYCRTANTTNVLKQAFPPKGNDRNALIAVAKSLPLDALQLVFAKAVSAGDDDLLLDASLDAYTQHLIWQVSNVLDGRLDVRNLEDLCPVFPILAAVTLSKMKEIAGVGGNDGRRALSMLLARFDCVASSRDLNPGPIPFSLRRAVRKGLLKMVDALEKEWADIVLDEVRALEFQELEKKVHTHLKKTYGGMFSRKRSASRWRKGLLHVSSYRNTDKCQGSNVCGPTVRLCEMETLEYTKKSRAIAPSKTITTEADSCIMRRQADDQKKMASQLLEAITDTRDRLGLGGEGEIEVELACP